MILALLGITFQGKCDFADYWKLSINDSVTYDSRNDSNAWTHAFKLNLSRSELAETDIISIQCLTVATCLDRDNKVNRCYLPC